MSDNISYVSSALSTSLVTGSSIAELQATGATKYGDIFKETIVSNATLNIPACGQNCVVKCSCNTNNGWFAKKPTSGSYVTATTTRKYALTDTTSTASTFAATSSSSPSTQTCYKFKGCDEEKGWFENFSATNLSSSNVSLKDKDGNAMAVSELDETKYNQIFNEEQITDSNGEVCVAKASCNNANGWYASTRDSNVGTKYITAVSTRSYAQNEVDADVYVFPGLNAAPSSTSTSASLTATVNTSLIIGGGIGDKEVSYKTSSGTQKCYKTWECPEYKCPDGYFLSNELPEGYATLSGSDVYKVCSLDPSIEEPKPATSSSGYTTIDNRRKCYLKRAKTCQDYGYKSSQSAGQSCTTHTVKLGDTNGTCYSCFYDKFTINVSISGEGVMVYWRLYRLGKNAGDKTLVDGGAELVGGFQCKYTNPKVTSVTVTEKGTYQLESYTYGWIPSSADGRCRAYCVCHIAEDIIKTQVVVDGTKATIGVSAIGMGCKQKNSDFNTGCQDEGKPGSGGGTIPMQPGGGQYTP